MKNLKRYYKIVVLEDNEFYNTLLTRKLKQFTEELSLELNCVFEIDSYTNANDCIRNLKTETDIAILDYYLGESKNALDILEKIKSKCAHCKIIIISQFENIKTSYQTLNQGAYHFILKDKKALANSCMVVGDIVKESAPEA